MRRLLLHLADLSHVGSVHRSAVYEVLTSRAVALVLGDMVGGDAKLDVVSRGRSGCGVGLDLGSTG